MSADNLLLFVGHGVVLCLILVVFLKNKSKSRAITHLLVLCIYSCLLGYGLIYKSGGGSALVWWFYWFLALLMHTFVLSFQLLRSYKNEQ
jgi:hypothetical protein